MTSNAVPKVSEIDGAGVVALVVLFGLFYFVALKPLTDRQKLEATQQKQLEIQHGKAESAAISLQTLTDHLTTVRRTIADSPLKLEPVHALNDRLAKIATLATAESLDIGDIRPGAVAIGDHYTAVPISLVGTGHFKNCVQFLHAMQEQFNDMTVTTLKLSGSPETGGLASFQFELRWYAEPERAAVSTVR